MDDDTELNVPVEVRSHELEQLHDWTPRIEQRLREVERDDEADSIERLYDEYIPNYMDADKRAYSGTPYISMPADDWRTLVRNLDRIYDDEGKNRVWWLRKKLVSRLRDRMDDMEGDDES